MRRTAGQRCTNVLSNGPLPPSIRKSSYALIPQSGLTAAGALACQIIGAAWPLSDLKALGGVAEKMADGAVMGDGVASELFLARVLRVEDVPLDEVVSDGSAQLPLLYHRRGYGTVQSHPPGPPSER